MERGFDSSFIDEKLIEQSLASAKVDTTYIRELLAKARALTGLSLDEVAALANVSDEALLSEIFATAKHVKAEIFGNRIVLFAPLYVSNRCSNECSYCAFRVRNRELQRKTLTQEEIAREAKLLVEQGHKRVVLVAGESYPEHGFQYVLDSIATLYKVTSGHGEIRRVYVNVAPLKIDEYRQLLNADIGAYQIFQETYHRATYAKVHLGGPKRDYDWRVTAMHRAMAAGIEDVGIGVLFGLYDWKFDLLALVQHVRALESAFNAGCHTISVPRMEPAVGSELSSQPPHAVSDQDLLKIIAILRLAVPYAGLVMSTRENAAMRRTGLEAGISQISAGSRTNPGGYTDTTSEANASQFQLGDHRALDEVVRDLAQLGHVPSFCTACYRIGRQGHTFQEIAKPGHMKFNCGPNALSTFIEYLEDYASPETRRAGELVVSDLLAKMPDQELNTSSVMIQQIRAGKRDVFV